MITKEKLGAAGEDLVAAYFQQLGCTVKRNEDKYDDVKDLLVDGRPVEVKTQTVYRKFPVLGGYSPAFTVDIAQDSNKIYRNQLNKCMNVDRLLFVARSSKNMRAVKIYEAPPLGSRKFSIIQNHRDKRFVAGFLIADMTEIASIEKPSIVDYFMDEWTQYAKSF